MHREAKTIYNHILGNDHFIIVPHREPDGDALGSATAMLQFLRAHKKTAWIFCSTPASRVFTFLQGMEAFSTDPAVWDDERVSTVITVDASDPSYAGIDRYLERGERRLHTIVFDHHATNAQFGHHNLVMPHAASTTEVLYMFFRAIGIPIDRHMATSLLTGLITDTGHFSNAATSTTALAAAGDLLRRGANIRQINHHVLFNKHMGVLKFWGRVLARLTHAPVHDMVYTYITRADFDACGIGDDEADGVANMLNHAREGKAALIVREQADGNAKVSMRTTRNDIDVSAIAKNFGGGGHKKAAGFTLNNMTAATALEHIWHTLETLTKNTYTTRV